MTLLKELVRRSALRGRDAGEVEVGGSSGEGSAFAHLTEDEEFSILLADWDLFVGDPNGAYTALTTGGQLQTFRDNPAIGVWQIGIAGESGVRLVAKGDASFNWANGSDPPDTTLRRNGDWGSGLVLEDDDGNGFVVGDVDGDYGALFPGTLQLHNSGGAVSIDAIAGVTNKIQLFGNSSGLRLTSPLGTTYDVTVTDDGTLDVTAV